MSGRLCNRLSQSLTIMLSAFLNNTRVLVMPKTDEPNNKANAGAGGADYDDWRGCRRSWLVRLLPQ